MSVCPFTRIENEVDTLERELLDLSFTHRPDIQHLTCLLERITVVSHEMAAPSLGDIDLAAWHDLRFKLGELTLNLAYYHTKAMGRSSHHALTALRNFYAETDGESGEPN